MFFVVKTLWCRVFVEVEVEIYQGDLAFSKLSEDLFLDVFVLGWVYTSATQGLWKFDGDWNQLISFPQSKKITSRCLNKHSFRGFHIMPSELCLC